MADLKIEIIIPEADVDRVLSGIAQAHRYDLAKIVEKNKDGKIIAEESLADFAKRKCEDWWNDTVFEGERREVIAKAADKLKSNIKKIGIKVK